MTICLKVLIFHVPLKRHMKDQHLKTDLSISSMDCKILRGFLQDIYKFLNCLKNVLQSKLVCSAHYIQVLGFGDQDTAVKSLFLKQFLYNLCIVLLKDTYCCH